METNNTTNTNTAADGSAIVSALEAAWADIRSNFPELPERVLFITGVGTQKGGLVRGHWRQTGWRTESNGDLPELFISGERLAEGGTCVLNTLIHEAVHALAACRSIKDTSRQGRYHNKRFAALAEEMGLRAPVNPDTTLGFSNVVITDETVEAYSTTIATLDSKITAHVPNLFEEFERGIALVLGMMRIWGWDISGNRGEEAANTVSPPPARKRQRRSGRKFQCDCTKITIPAAVAEDFDAKCNKCGEDFVDAERIANSGEDF